MGQWVVCSRIDMMSMLKRVGNRLRELLSSSYVQAGILVFLIALLMFGLGYLAGRDLNPAPIVIEKAEGS